MTDKEFEQLSLEEKQAYFEDFIIMGLSKRTMF